MGDWVDNPKPYLLGGFPSPLTFRASLHGAVEGQPPVFGLHLLIGLISLWKQAWPFSSSTTYLIIVGFRKLWGGAGGYMLPQRISTGGTVEITQGHLLGHLLAAPPATVPDAPFPSKGVLWAHPAV